MVGFANSAYKVGRNEGSGEAGGCVSSSWGGECGPGDDSDSYSEDSEGTETGYTNTVTEDRWDRVGGSPHRMLTIFISDLTSARSLSLPGATSLHTTL